jgi:hypothetical protein
MELEELSITNNTLSVYDDDENGLIAIEMDINLVKKIFDLIDVKSTIKKEITIIDEFKYVFDINIDDDITIYGRIYEDDNDDIGSYCHEFEFDSVSVEAWNFLKEYINKK